ncbi:hypothetical protein AB0L44_26035 [Nonomuraea wenchangensis]|uniref:hypothetical protein n=1 Tax=Nonomuraea wenchangensis TaxID=568860 RepID=UPI00343806C7
MSTRFRCSSCGQRSTSVVGCQRCGTSTGRHVQLCPQHGATCRPGCRTCRTRFRSPSGR